MTAEQQAHEPATHAPDRNLALELTRVTEAAAMAAARWVGRGHAMRMALGFPLPADEAYRIGLAQWLVPPAKLMDQALEVAAHLASLPPLAAMAHSGQRVNVARTTAPPLPATACRSGVWMVTVTSPVFQMRERGLKST